VVYKRGILKKDGFIVLERPSYLKFDARFFECYRTQHLGKKSLDFFRYRAEDIAKLEEE